MADLQAATSAYPRHRTYPPDSLQLDWLMSAASVWLILGLFLDGWAHNSFPEDIETFLTPWHAVLYSGFAAAAGLLVVTTLRNVSRGYTGFSALPRGYLPALAGVLIFGFAGTFDFVWHSLFGFEANQEALLSPPHLVLALGGSLMTGAPLRAAWGRRQDESKSGWRELLPALLSLAALLSTFTFFTQYANVFQHPNLLSAPRPTQTYFWDTTLLAGVLVPAALMMFFVLLAVRRWRLPFGSLTLLLTTNTTLMFVMGSDYSGQHWPIVLAALAGGLLADGLLAVLKPSGERPTALRIFAFAVPFLYFALYFGTMLLTSTLWWRIHMWLGAPVLAGVIGLGLSYLIVPPPIPTARDDSP